MSAKMENNFVCDSISKLYLNSNTGDVLFAFTTGSENVKVPAHKAILAITSPVFHAMFFGQLKESDVVKMVDCNADAFREFLQLFYSPEVSISLENIESVVRLADKYDVLKRLNSCAKLLETKISKENVIWGYQLAISLRQPYLKTICENFIQDHAIDVLKSDIFRRCAKAVVESILQMKSLNACEGDIFKACIEWAESSCESNGLDNGNAIIIREQLSDCFDLIRFGAMTSAEIISILSNKKYIDLFSRDELLDIFGILSDKDFEFKALKDSQKELRTFKWVYANVLTHTRKSNSHRNHRNDGQSVNVQNSESTWFSSNVRLLFGTVRFVRLLHVDDVNIDFTIYINEYELQEFSPKIPCKILYTETVKVSSRINRFVLLSQPIMIHPNKMYEIRFESSSLPNDALKRNYVWKSTIDLAKGVRIKFHQNPFESNNEQRGLVYQLRFSQF